MVEPKIADPVRLTSRMFESLSSIARLFDIGKISSEQSEKNIKSEKK